MKRFLRNYQDWVLGVFGILLFVAIVGGFIWGFTVLGTEIPNALQPRTQSSKPLQFDFSGYQKLNLGTQ